MMGRTTMTMTSLPAGHSTGRFPRTIPDWNTLLQEIVAADTLDCFKSRLNSHLKQWPYPHTPSLSPLLKHWNYLSPPPHFFSPLFCSRYISTVRLPTETPSNNVRTFNPLKLDIKWKKKKKRSWSVPDAICVGATPENWETWRAKTQRPIRAWQCTGAQGQGPVREVGGGGEGGMPERKTFPPCKGKTGTNWK